MSLAIAQANSWCQIHFAGGSLLAFQATGLALLDETAVPAMAPSVIRPVNLYGIDPTDAVKLISFPRSKGFSIFIGPSAFSAERLMTWYCWLMPNTISCC